MPKKFRVGDLVQLKSGSPTMTVTKLDSSEYGHEGEIECTWFAGAKSMHGYFPDFALVPDAEKGES